MPPREETTIIPPKSRAINNQNCPSSIERILMKKEGWFTDGCEIYKTHFKDHSLSQRINILLKEGKGVKSPFFFVSDRFQNLQKSSGGEKSNL